jgi:hypothetical protein
MVRSAAAVFAVLILPAFSLAQQPVGTHTVVRDDTLWDLAQRYYQDPFRWRVIYEANRDSIADPNLIYPNEVFVIPGLPGTAAPAVAGGPEAAPPPAAEPAVEAVQPGPTDALPADLVQFGFRQARPAEQVRTIFWRDTTPVAGATSGGVDMSYVAVPRDMVYSAPWLVRSGEEVRGQGRVAGFASAAERASTIRSFARIRIDMPAPARLGAELQLFRVTHTIEDVGQVVVPTGVATVEAIGGTGVVAVVTKEYQRIQPGDLARPVPSYQVQPGRVAREIAGGPEAMIVGVAGRQELNSVGHVAFLDLGSDDGIVIGDEFVLFNSATRTREGSLQVIAVTPNMASARILSMVGDVFRQGVVVRLARTMR